VQGRREPSPEIKQKVTELTAGKTDTLAKMQALSNYVQRDIRYVAIELRIGGWQPHPARDIFNNHYGDCKDKATLLSTMLKEIGVDSYYVVVNTSRGVVNAETLPQHSFDHIILAIHLPADLKDSPLKSVYTDSELGRLLIFDPTDELTPLGGPLQRSYALLVDPDNGELIQLPILSPQSSGVHRSGKLTLDANGTLSGEFLDLLYGDYAAFQRYAYREMTKKEDQIKPIETLLSHSVDTYQITKAAIGNLGINCGSCLREAGRVAVGSARRIGRKGSRRSGKKEPRKYSIEFEGPRRDSDRIEITLPAGYQVDEVPPPVDVDYPFGSYRSKTEMSGDAVVYTRTFETKEVSVRWIRWKI
jgi:Transglutaminase-like superfamily